MVSVLPLQDVILLCALEKSLVAVMYVDGWRLITVVWLPFSCKELKYVYVPEDSRSL